MEEREKLKSRLGFILLSAGCAIGIGNVWKFPYTAGQGGGGAFVLFYLLFLIILGLPIMTMEFAVGRASQKSPVKAYQALEKPGQKWHIHGIITLIGCYLLMMFYTTVTGWMLHYFYMTVTGQFQGLDADGVSGQFTTMLSKPLTMGFWMGVVVCAGVFVCSRGLQNGLEKVTKVMMTSLLIIMIILAVNSFFMDGAKEGLAFYLIPDFERMKQIGIAKTITGAMNQAFFTLSLGIGAMAIWGSYIGKERSLLGESVNIAILDTFVAITSGLIIFPACFTFHVDQTSGPSLIFITLPNIFNHIPLGRLWGSLFFLFMFFAAFSTILAVFENIISCGMELTGCSPELYAPVLEILAQMGCRVERGGESVQVARFGRLYGAGRVFTGVYPALATDAAPPLAAAMLCAEGESSIEDVIFERRFACAEGFAALGGRVNTAGRVLHIRPGGALRGTRLSAPDLRGGAALVLAALAAQGRSQIGGVAYLDRGYADFTEILASLGARIYRETKPA